MKARTAWISVAVLLLALPLMGVAFLWIRAPSEWVVEGWRFAPFVAPAEARARISLLRSCQDDAQCESPLVCFHDSQNQRRYCSGTGCQSDEWCTPFGSVCRAIPMRGRGKMAVRQCVFVGTREEGQPCLRAPQAPLRQWACAEGLVCAGEGWCGRRCVPGEASTCPEGFFCARGDPEGPVCQPTCEGRACPEGQECLRREGGVSVCMELQGRHCDKNPCDKGRVCVVDPLLYMPTRAYGMCLQTCGGEGDAACPKDFVCHQGQCRLGCSFGKPFPCLAQFCVSTDDQGTGVCMSSPEQWRVELAPAREQGGAPPPR